MALQSNGAVLSDEQREFFDANGYLVIEDALPPDVIAELDAAVDEIYAREKAANRLEKNGKLNLRNCIVHHDAFLQLLDWPTTAPLAWQILNWNIQMITSHLIVLPSGPEPSAEEKRRGGYHRDGGSSSREMTEPHPRILLKIAYTISDQRDPRVRSHATRAGKQSAVGPSGHRSGNGPSARGHRHERQSRLGIHL